MDTLSQFILCWIISDCRSCLLYDIERNEVYHCTKCAASFGKDLSEAFVRDDTLQKLVYKMVPEVYWQELFQRGEYLKKRFVSSDEKATILDKVSFGIECLNKFCSSSS